MKKTSYIYVSLSLCCLTGCIESTDEICDNRVQMALTVASGQNQSGTRLGDAVTLVDGTSIRTVQNFWLIPYGVTATKDGDVWVPRKITATDSPIADPINNVANVANKDRQYHFFGTPEESLIGTASFLCYAQANPVSADKKENGSITTNLSTTRMATGDIYFAPTPIYDNNNEVHEKAVSMANYLTNIAIAGGWSTTTDANWKLIFDIFTNEGDLMAGSSANVQALVNDLQTAVNKMPDSEQKTAILAAIGGNIATSVGNGFPAEISLPDGAAVLQWNAANNCFEPQTQATTLAQMVSQNRYVYPAEMYFYSNSQLHTSTSEVPATSYVDKTWTEVLNLYSLKYGTIDEVTRGAAIIEPLHYGVGSLKATVAAKAATLQDADEKEITLSEDLFPLTGMLISGQYSQGFDFTPKDELTEYVIYDSQFSNVYLQNTTSPAFSTLAFQSKDGSPVWIALEFQNNSTEVFRGVNGLVYPGTKFYLMAGLTPETTSTEDYMNRVFTKDYITQVTLTVNSLKNAYNVIPDLLSGRMEVGVQVETEWIEATQSKTELK